MTERNSLSDTEGLHELAMRRWRLAIILSLAVVVIYFGFILAIAFNKELMGMVLVPGLSLGILAGALVIVLAWVTTLIYTRWANGTYDRELAALQAKRRNRVGG